VSGDAPAAPTGPVPDVIAPELDALFVGINPGFASARAGHHFANPANPFWRLLHESGFTARRLAPAEERELLREGLGITNLVARETAGVADLTRADLDGGLVVLAHKVRRHRPRAVVFVGLTAYAAVARPRRGRVSCGEQPEGFEGARAFVVPNPSGRNAHFTYAQMKAAFRAVARALGRLPARRPGPPPARRRPR
jgi:double-stranded uracil-DNA glycosylase